MMECPIRFLYKTNNYPKKYCSDASIMNQVLFKYYRTTRDKVIVVKLKYHQLDWVD